MVTREQLLNDPTSGARPLFRDEEADRAENAELSRQWLPVTSPAGHRGQVQASHPEVLDDMRRAGWRIREPRQPGRQAEPELEAG